MRLLPSAGSRSLSNTSTRKPSKRARPSRVASHKKPSRVWRAWLRLATGMPSAVPKTSCTYSGAPGSGTKLLAGAAPVTPNHAAAARSQTPAPPILSRRPWECGGWRRRPHERGAPRRRCEKGPLRGCGKSRPLKGRREKGSRGHSRGAARRRSWTRGRMHGCRLVQKGCRQGAQGRCCRGAPGRRGETGAARRPCVLRFNLFRLNLFTSARSRNAGVGAGPRPATSTSRTAASEMKAPRSIAKH
jgi:hypothetical protein